MVCLVACTLGTGTTCGAGWYEAGGVQPEEMEPASLEDGQLHWSCARTADAPKRSAEAAKAAGWKRMMV